MLGISAGLCINVAYIYALISGYLPRVWWKSSLLWCKKFKRYSFVVNRWYPFRHLCRYWLLRSWTYCPSKNPRQRRWYVKYFLLYVILNCKYTKSLTLKWISVLYLIFLLFWWKIQNEHFGEGEKIDLSICGTYIKNYAERIRETHKF